MYETIWELPVPSTALDYEAEFQMLPGRACSLTCGYEITGGKMVMLELLFDGVESFKCTYHRACTVEMIEAYGRVVNVGSSEWLGGIRQRLSKYDEDVTDLRHLMIYFDDGPCYEFICRSFKAQQKIAEKNA